jgi:hypothetical protein
MDVRIAVSNDEGQTSETQTPTLPPVTDATGHLAVE